jgi:NADH dehydrogenase/NADH:ubiquinone oxidoreductase subunit G
MSDVFSQYVTLLDEIERIPVIARESVSMSVEERAAAVAHVIELVRDQVLPQSDRDTAGRQALLHDEGVLDRAALAGAADHEAILAAVDQLARVNPTNAARVRSRLYRLHTAIAAHFSEAEVMIASMRTHEETSPEIASQRFTSREHAGASSWFG